MAIIKLKKIIQQMLKRLKIASRKKNFLIKKFIESCGEHFIVGSESVEVVLTFDDRKL